MLMLHAGPGVRHLSQAAGARHKGKMAGNWQAMSRGASEGAHLMRWIAKVFSLGSI